MKIKLNHINEQPVWLRANIYLLSNHRAPTNSYAVCVKSWFALHTETINIWTHLLPCFLFVYLLSRTSLNPNIDYSDKIWLSIFLAGALLCHMFSVCYHSFSCHSQRVGNIFKRLDFFGITMMITASLLPLIRYSLNQYKALAGLYLVGSITFAVLSVVFSMSDRFSKPSFRRWRALAFSLYALYGIFPYIHWIQLEAHLFGVYTRLSMALFCLNIMALLYLVGASLYAMQIPERLFPGKCDLFLHSHQIFHVLVTIASLVYYQALTNLVDHVNESLIAEGNERLPIDT